MSVYGPSRAQALGCCQSAARMILLQTSGLTTLPRLSRSLHRGAGNNGRLGQKGLKVPTWCTLRPCAGKSWAAPQARERGGMEDAAP